MRFLGGHARAAASGGQKRWRRAFLLTAAAAAVSLASGCSAVQQASPAASQASSQGWSQASSQATNASQASYEVRASQTSATYMRLPDGDELEIPAGALAAGSTVQAVYGRPPTGSWAGTLPVGAPVHFVVSPAQKFRQPVLLESYLGQDAALAAAPLGYYRISTLNTSTHQWVEVPSSYDPQTHMLVTELWHFSWWSTVRQSQTVTLTAAKCLNDALGINESQIGRAFLNCLIKQGLTKLNSAIETQILTDLLPKNCWSALQTDGIVAAPGGPLATLIAVLTGIETEPACRGTASSGGVAAPTVSKVSPSSGPAAGGTKVTITGWMFAEASSVTFGGRAASFTIALNSNSTITAISPLDTPGTVDVHVTDAGGTSPTTSADRFTYKTASGTGPGATQPQPQPTVTSPGTTTPASPQAWTANEALLPFNANPVPDAALNAVSCPTTSTCVAGGQYTDTSGDQQALLMVETGGTWQAAQAPLPANADGNPYASVAAVSCPSATECMAGGTYTDNNGDAQGLLLLWSDGSWTATEAPLPANANPAGPPSTTVAAVSCPAVSECFAAGSYASAGYYQGLLLSWSGGSWNTAEAPVPSNAASIPDEGLQDLSCPSTSECVADVEYSATTAAAEAGANRVLLTWEGGSWTTQEVTGTGGIGDTGLACFTTSACVDVSTADVDLLSESNGSWSTTTIANNQGWWGVSCPTATECVVGGTGGSINGSWTALQLWSGGSWTSIATPVPDNDAYEVVNGVSCPTAATCVAVGAYNNSTPRDPTQALVLTGPA